MNTNEYDIDDATENYIYDSTEDQPAIFKLLNKLKAVKQKEFFMDKKEGKGQKVDLKK